MLTLADYTVLAAGPQGPQRRFPCGRPPSSLLDTTMIDTHVLNRWPAAVRSPADRMFTS
jgi:hypothetical protein